MRGFEEENVTLIGLILKAYLKSLGVQIYRGICLGLIASGILYAGGCVYIVSL